jgi:hypothetical protein
MMIDDVVRIVFTLSLSSFSPFWLVLSHFDRTRNDIKRLVLKEAKAIAYVLDVLFLFLLYRRESSVSSRTQLPFLISSRRSQL